MIFLRDRLNQKVFNPAHPFIQNMTKQFLKSDLETADKLFELEQKDVRNLVYWRKSYKQSFIYKNLSKIKNLFLSREKSIKKKISLVLWLFYQHSFQSMISTEKGEPKKRYNKKIAKLYSDSMYKYYLYYWGTLKTKNIFPLLAKAFTRNDAKDFEKILKNSRGKDKVWNMKNPLINNMYKRIKIV